jgi:hypothetical protein
MSALSRRARYGDDICGCALCYPEFDALLVDAGRFTWGAGPLTKGSGLCHGTGGNGYAFLKLHRRTNDPSGFDRARQFAMTAIVPVSRRQMAVGRGRYSLWTGDVGLAIYFGTASRRASFPDDRRVLIRTRRHVSVGRISDA